MKPVRFHDEARVEISHEALYYNTISRALAERFVKAVYLDRPGEVYVLALAPFARRPGYWRSRRNDAWHFAATDG